jgi:hypothetical protein
MIGEAKRMHDDPGGHPLESADNEVAGLKREVERLRAALSEREDRARAECARFAEDLLQTRRELAQARVAQEDLTEQLSACRAAPQAQTPAAARDPGTRSWRARWSRTARRRERDIQLLYQSGLFDADWYRVEYPDVANTRLDPAEHYLLHGAAEGRNPGPQFNTNQYLYDHPDLADSGENPLLHFLGSRGTADAR